MICLSQPPTGIPSVGVALLGSSGEILSHNQSAAELCQLDPAVRRPPILWDLIHPDEVGQAREQMGELVAGGCQEVTLLQRILRRSGDFQVVQAVYSALGGALPAQVVIVLVAIEDAQQQLTDFSDQSSLPKTILDNVDSHVYVKDQKGRYLYANPSSLKLLAPSGESIIGKSDAELLPAEQALALINFDREVFEDGGTLVREERIGKGDGSEQIFLSQKLIYKQAGSADCLIGFSTDTTAMRRARAEVECSEERFRLLAENSSDVVMWLASDGIVRWVSPSLTAALGWQPEEWIGKLGTDFLIHRGKEERYCANLEQLRQGRGAVVARDQVMAKDQSVHWVETHANYYINEAGEVDGFVASFHVIDVIVEAEQMLRQSEQRHRRLADHMLDVVWAINLEGVFTYMSPSVERVRGFTPEEIMQMQLEYQFPPDSYAVVLEGLEEARRNVAAGRPVLFEAEIEEYCKDGSTVWTDVRATSLYDERGSFLEIVGVSRDVTMRHRLKEELHISEQRYRLLAETACDVIWTMTPEGVISYISPSVQRLRGVSPEEAVAQPLEQIHPPASLKYVANYWEQMINEVKGGISPQPFRDELEYYCSDGSTVWADVIARPIVNSSGELVQVIGTSRDISERKRYEVQLQLSNQKLEAMATHDGLTGIWNRNRLSEEIRDLISQADRYGEDISLIICDIDHFKLINDRYGHLAGDHVLVEFCKRIKVNLRNSDAFGRWGGEEFLVVLPHGDIAAGKALAEKLRSCIASQPFSEVGMVTASFGVAQHQRREDQLAWIHRADQHLYIAKNGGRNRVVTADR